MVHNHFGELPIGGLCCLCTQHLSHWLCLGSPNTAGLLKVGASHDYAKAATLYGLHRQVESFCRLLCCFCKQRVQVKQLTFVSCLSQVQCSLELKKLFLFGCQLARQLIVGALLLLQQYLVLGQSLMQCITAPSATEHKSAVVCCIVAGVANVRDHGIASLPLLTCRNTDHTSSPAALAHQAEQEIEDNASCMELCHNKACQLGPGNVAWA